MEINFQYLLPKVNFQSVLLINPFSSTKPYLLKIYFQQIVLTGHWHSLCSLIVYLMINIAFLHRNLIHKK